MIRYLYNHQASIVLLITQHLCFCFQFADYISLNFFLHHSYLGAGRKSFCLNNVELQNSDGGWGLHIEGHSTMFGSVLSYVTLRLLGEGANDGEGAMEKGRKWILDHGSATAITSWGKMWLTVQ